MKFGMLVNTQAPPDGRRIPQLYDEILAEAELADAVGFDGVYVPEHHMKADGCLCAPIVFLAAIAARTKRIRLGTTVMLLPQSHPIHVAEEIAVLDNISRGRAILGVGLSLVDDELALFGITREKIVSRFTESIEILRRSWSGETFSFNGEFYQLNNVTITPRIMQPEIPIWMGAMSDPSVQRAGRLGLGIVMDPLHVLSIVKMWADLYRQTAAEHGNAGRTEVVLIRDGWVSKDSRELQQTWWPTILDYHLFQKHLGFFKPERFNSDVELWEHSAKDEDWTYDRVSPERLIAGSPAEVITEIERYRDETGCDEIIFAFRHRAGPGHEDTMRCIELFGKEVIPYFT